MKNPLKIIVEIDAMLANPAIYPEAAINAEKSRRWWTEQLESFGTAVTAENLNDLVEFNVPFTIIPTAAGRRLAPAADTSMPDCITLRENTLQLLIDFAQPADTSWEPVTGYSGQHGYSGPVMHASEYLGGSMANDMLARFEPETFVVMEVFSEGDEEIEFDDPAGWILLRKR